MILAQATTIDLSPILTPLLQVAGLVLAGLASWAISKAATLLHIQGQAALINGVVATVDRGIAFAQNKITAQVSSGNAPFAHVDVGNAVAASAANYVIQKAPDALKALGMDATHVADLVLARLPQANPVPALPAAGVPQPNPAA